MRLVEIPVGKATGIGRDQRQITIIGKIEQVRLRPALDLVEAASQLDVEPIGKQRLQAIGISERAIMLFLGEQAGQSAFATGG